MEIQVTCRSQERKEFLESCARFFAKELKLKQSRYKVTIRSVYNLGKDRGSRGEVFQCGDRHIYMVLDSRLSMTQLLLTLAHEMVHVKQIARGQYRGQLARNGRLLSIWRGVPVRAVYEKRPWEIEAFSRQGQLVESLIKFVAKKQKKILNSF